MPVQRGLLHKPNQLQGDEGSQDWGVPCYLVSITCCVISTSAAGSRGRTIQMVIRRACSITFSCQARSPAVGVNMPERWPDQANACSAVMLMWLQCCSFKAAVTAVNQPPCPLLLVPCSTLQKDIEKCDSSLSEGMQISVQGDILRYAQLAFEGKPVAPTQDGACETAPEGPLSSKDDFSNTADPSAASASAMYLRGGTTYFTGSGDIYTGIFRATENFQAADDEFGRLQLVYARQVDSTGLFEPPKGYYVAKPYSLSLQAYKYKPYDEDMYTGPVRN